MTIGSFTAKASACGKSAQTDAVDADTVFQLASVSKPIASTVLAALVDKGTIHWDDW